MHHTMHVLDPLQFKDESFYRLLDHLSQFVLYHLASRPGYHFRSDARLRPVILRAELIEKFPCLAHSSALATHEHRSYYVGTERSQWCSPSPKNLPSGLTLDIFDLLRSYN